jgi:protocatechuate 4,5-dioxygenase, alpha chain
VPDQATRAPRDYDDIPGTYVFDGEHSRKGYALNMFCMSLNQAANRETFRADPAAYLDRHRLTPEQRQAVEQRDWLGMLQLGGNIYYTFKLAIVDGLTMQDVGAKMSGVTTEEFSRMMLAGGRPIEGNRSKSAGSREDESASSREDRVGPEARRG